jgi:type II secretory ATPase GspE/PulE/Tfp pilus assembly ATPase PilB-like protein
MSNGRGTSNGHAPTAIQPAVLISPDRDVARFIRRAWQARASDLYLLTNDRCVQVTMRQWGVVLPLEQLSAEHGRHCISYIKALAGIDITES